MQTCTLRDLVPEGAAAAIETDPDVARLKSSADMVRAIEAAVRFYEEPPTDGMTVATHWADIWLSADDWAEAFEAPDPGTPHNEARDQIWEELLTILVDKHERRAMSPAALLRRSLPQNARAASTTFNRRGRCSTRPTSSATCGRCPPTCACARPGSAPTRCGGCSAQTPEAWTVSDLPLLDAARQRLGDPEASRRRRRHDAAARRRTRAHGPGRRRPDRGRRLRDGRPDDHAARRGPAGRPGRRGRAARRRPGPARRPVRAHRRGRGAGADRRRVADAAAALPVPELHHRRGPRPGPARVHRVVAGAARADRARPGRRWPP